MGDVFNRSEEQQARDAQVGVDIAIDLLEQMMGTPVPVAYNVLGNMVWSTFSAIKFEKPSDALIEFDHWCAYTRRMLEKSVMERMS